MTDAQLQPLYDLIGAVFKAGGRHAKDPDLFAADSLIPLTQQIQAYVEARIWEEREAFCIELAGLAGTALNISDTIKSLSAPSPSGSAT